MNPDSLDTLGAAFLDLTQAMTEGREVPVCLALPIRILRYQGTTRRARKLHHECVAGLLGIPLREAKDLCHRASIPRTITIYPLNPEFQE